MEFNPHVSLLGDCIVTGSCNFSAFVFLLVFQPANENLNMAKMSLSSSTSGEPVTEKKEEDNNGKNFVFPNHFTVKLNTNMFNLYLFSTN